MNSTGLYNELKEKLVKPEFLKFVKQNAEGIDHQMILSNMIKSLNENVSNQTEATQTESPTKAEMNDKQLSARKHTQIAIDFERQDNQLNAYKHYQTAYNIGESLDIDTHMNTLQNLIKILIKQSKIALAITMLTDFVSNQANHTQSLLFLTALLIEHKHNNAKCAMYQLHETQSSITSIMLKAAFFAMNNDEKRIDINFKKAIKLCNGNMSLLQQPFNALFDLQCFETISIILNVSQKFDQFDINFHINNAKKDRAMQRFGTALSSINEAIQINDELPQLYAIKGHIQYESDRTADAMESYIKHLQLLPGTTESLLPPNPNMNIAEIIDKLALYRLGKMYQNQSNQKLALQTFLQGIQYDTDSWSFWYEAGDSLFKLKDYAQSVHCFEQCNMINNNEPHSWCMLSVCYLALNQTKIAIKMMKETVKFGKNNIADMDKRHIQEFGQNLINLGHIQSGSSFKEFSA